jgi:hypothetical protein
MDRHGSARWPSRRSAEVVVYRSGRVRDSSSHPIGVETGAPGLARTA